LEGLTRKVLCTRHNNILSEVDNGGIAAIKVFREEFQQNTVLRAATDKIRIPKI